MDTDSIENWRGLGAWGFLKKLYSHHKPDGGALLLRLVIGVLMLASGWWKLGHMDMNVGFFASMGFGPFAAHFVAWLELIGGILLVIGILTKPVCVAFATEMAVVIWGTAAVPSVIYFGHDYNFVLLAVFLSIYLMGPGKYSLAYLLCRKK
ncbi:MAG: DoxX family protein [Patescibacteria group bacterium]|nr:DoxX family protein [Patescibacteria group bacterium]MDE1967144.1 DoxX family protein [Patescibacteria group bacterium]